MFEAAQPIQCSELVSDSGEWRTVAFFNEDPRLGAWYHNSLEEVKRDLTQYIFSGSCDAEHGDVQLVTKVPVLDSVERYNAGRIRFNEIRMNTNPAVRAAFSTRAQIYTFELPYLYVDRKKVSRDPVYSLIPQSVDERVDPSVTNHWECKSVRAADVTFQFLICQTWVLPRDASARRQSRPTFGSSAYHILSDGKEASTSVKLSFGGGDGDKAEKVETPPPPQPEVRPSATTAERRPPPTPPDLLKDATPLWKIPEAASRLADLKEDEFRILFSAQTWTGKITASQVLFDQKIAGPDVKPPAVADYCTWKPSSGALVSRVLAKEPDTDVQYTLTATDRTSQAPTSISFDLKTHTGSRLGTLQCMFPRSESAAAVTFDRWVAVVGAHLTIESRP
ncbi:MAG TPA: hypothetical protein VFD22_06780 [Gemmatimonadaceae bacterium]|nr:hypothetical protein [Gemmatimonadaceae bacterium]